MMQKGVNSNLQNLFKQAYFDWKIDFFNYESTFLKSKTKNIKKCV